MIKKYIEFIKEADETEEVSTEEQTPDQSQTIGTDSDKFTEIKDEVKSMIEKTIEKSGGELKQFIDSFNKNPEDVKIEGFINDSDIYEFYLKWRNDIDEVLNDINFFDENPADINVIGLYDYIIKGTEKALQEVVKMIK